MIENILLLSLCFIKICGTLISCLDVYLLFLKCLETKVILSRIELDVQNHSNMLFTNISVKNKNYEIELRIFAFPERTTQTTYITIHTNAV